MKHIYKNRILTSAFRVRYSLLFCLLFFVTTLTAAADFNKGVYYFDNSKVKFQSVRFVAGDTTNCQTIVFEMIPVKDTQWWQLDLSEKLSGIDHYAFIESDMPADTVMMNPRHFVDSLSTVLEDSFKSTILYGMNRTKYGVHYDENNNQSWVYCPMSHDFFTNGYWRPVDSYEAEPSRTLPIIYINTKDSTDVTTKDYYIAGTLWIDNCDIEGYELLGSEKKPLDMEIKGRGNYSWFYSFKKPFRLKLDKKKSPLGLDNSKHFVLMPKCLDYSGYLRNEIGFELSRQLNMPYTTSEVPVEVVFNGDYLGLYFLCEKIRVEEGRVDIVEQEDLETDPEKITGGWLLETRGWANPAYHQHENKDRSRMSYCFESHTPEVLSAVQSQYLANLISKTDSCIFVPNKTDRGWESFIDINSLVRFYIIHEVMENPESFDGSLYIYKDKGENEKLHFGPVWDFDNSYWNPKYNQPTTCNNYIYNYDTSYDFLWIEEICKFPSFRNTIKRVWKEFMNNSILEKLKECAYEWRRLIEDAERHDLVRWRNYASKHSQTAPQEFLNMLARKVEWLDQQWNKNFDGDVNGDDIIDVKDMTMLISYNLGDMPTGFISDCADLNQDGIIDIQDLTFLINMILN